MSAILHCARAGSRLKLVFVHGRAPVHGILVLQIEFECLFVGVFLINRFRDLNKRFFEHSRAICACQKLPGLSFRLAVFAFVGFICAVLPVLTG